ncbi:hypothetical protein EON68_03890, partial [archaeon]
EHGRGEKAVAAAAGEEAGEQVLKRRRNRADDFNLQPGQAIVSVRGEPDKIDAGVQTVVTLLREYTEMRVPVTGPVVAALLANKGHVISAMQTETGVLVDLERDAAAASDAAERKPRGAGGRDSAATILLCGTSAAIRGAEERLRELIDAHLEASVSLPDAGAASEVVGKGGVNIKALESELGVQMDVDKSTLTVRMVGSKPALLAATERMKALLEKYAKEHATLFIDRAQLPSLIGKGGANIKALQEELGVSINAEANGEIRLAGSEEAVEAAKARIAEVCRLHASVSTLSVDTAAVGAIIGKGGANVRKLEERFSVSIAADATAGVFTLRGEDANIAAAKVAIKRQSREAMRDEAEVSVPTDKLGAIIGTRGARLRQLEQDTG